MSTAPIDPLLDLRRSGSPRHTTVAIYADVNPNLIDGSTIWLQSVALCWLRVPRTRVIVVAREPISNMTVLEPVRAAGADIKTLDELCAARTADGAERLERALELLDTEEGVDVFLVRGEAHLLRLAANESLRRRLWGYWLRRPRVARPIEDVELFSVAEGVHRLLVQSDAWKGVLESVFGVPAEKVFVLPPMVPDEAWDISASRTEPALIYSGKLDKDYNVEEYLALPAQLARAGIDVRVEFLGDKFNRAEGDSEFIPRIRAALENTPSVIWHRGLERRAALERMARGLFGLCWRSAAYDTSLELSTKLLEFCALGVPPLLNRTDVHAELLGDDYPYFVSSTSDIASAIQRATSSPEEYSAVRRKIRSLARRHSFASVSSRLAAELRVSGCRAARLRDSGERRRTRVVIASHDNKFLSAVLGRLEQDPALEIRYDNWHTSRRHDEKRSSELLEWADVVFCEWCMGAAVWYSQRVRSDQRCIVRLHRFEAFEKEPHLVAFQNVRKLIVVSGYFKELCVSRFGVDPDKIVVLPQYVDCRQFQRKKHPTAAYTLGLVGINGFFHKRFDRALAILRHLRAQDERWRLRIRTTLPWDIDWVWNRENEVEQFTRHFRSFLDDPVLRDAVIFDAPGTDMAEWFRHVGYILSTSDSEGCHTSVAEGMASGAIPVIYRWPGAETVYPARFVFDDVETMVRFLSGTAAADTRAERSGVLRTALRFDVEVTRRYLRRLFTST